MDENEILSLGVDINDDPFNQKAEEIESKITSLQEKASSLVPMAQGTGLSGYGEAIKTKYDHWISSLTDIVRARNAIDNASNSIERADLTAVYRRKVEMADKTIQDIQKSVSNTQDFAKDITPAITNTLVSFADKIKKSLLTVATRATAQASAQASKGIKKSSMLSDDELLKAFISSSEGKSLQAQIKSVNPQAAKTSVMSAYIKSQMPILLPQSMRSDVAGNSNVVFRAAPESFREMVPASYRTIPVRRPTKKEELRTFGSTPDGNTKLTREEQAKLDKIVQKDHLAADAAVAAGVYGRSQGKLYYNNEATRDMVNAMGGINFSGIVTGARGHYRYGTHDVEDPDNRPNISRKIGHNKTLDSELRTARSMDESFSWYNPGYYRMDQAPQFDPNTSPKKRYVGQINHLPHEVNRGFAEYALDMMAQNVQITGISPVKNINGTWTAFPHIHGPQRASAKNGQLSISPDDFHTIGMNGSMLMDLVHSMPSASKAGHNDFDDNMIYLKHDERLANQYLPEKEKAKLKAELKERLTNGYEVNNTPYIATRVSKTHTEFMKASIVDDLGRYELGLAPDAPYSDEIRAAGLKLLRNGAGNEFSSRKDFAKAAYNMNLLATDGEDLSSYWGMNFGFESTPEAEKKIAEKKASGELTHPQQEKRIMEQLGKPNMKVVVGHFATGEGKDAIKLMDGANWAFNKGVQESFQGRVYGGKATFVKQDLIGMKRDNPDQIIDNDITRAKIAAIDPSIRGRKRNKMVQSIMMQYGDFVIPGAGMDVRKDEKGNVVWRSDLIVPWDTDFLEVDDNIKNKAIFKDDQGNDLTQAQLNDRRSRDYSRHHIYAKTTYDGAGTSSRWLSKQIVNGQLAGAFQREDIEAYFANILQKEIAHLDDEQYARDVIFGGDQTIDLNSEEARKKKQDHIDNMLQRYTEGDRLMPTGVMSYGMAAPWAQNVLNEMFVRNGQQLTPLQRKLHLGENDVVSAKSNSKFLSLVRFPATLSGNIKAKNLWNSNDVVGGGRSTVGAAIRKSMSNRGLDEKGIYFNPVSPILGFLQGMDFDGDKTGQFDLSTMFNIDNLSSTDKKDFAQVMGLLNEEATKQVNGILLAAFDNMQEKAKKHPEEQFPDASKWTDEQKIAYVRKNQKARKENRTLSLPDNPDKTWKLDSMDDLIDYMFGVGVTSPMMGQADRATDIIAALYNRNGEINPEFAQALLDHEDQYDVVSTHLKTAEKWAQTEEQTSASSFGRSFARIFEWAAKDVTTKGANDESGYVWDQAAQEKFNKRRLDEVNLPTLTNGAVLGTLRQRSKLKQQGLEINGHDIHGNSLYDWNTILDSKNMPTSEREGTEAYKLTMMLRQAKAGLLNGDFIALSQEDEDAILAQKRLADEEIWADLKKEQKQKQKNGEYFNLDDEYAKRRKAAGLMVAEQISNYSYTQRAIESDSERKASAEKLAASLGVDPSMLYSRITASKAPQVEEPAAEQIVEQPKPKETKPKRKKIVQTQEQVKAEEAAAQAEIEAQKLKADEVLKDVREKSVQVTTTDKVPDTALETKAEEAAQKATDAKQEQAKEEQKAAEAKAEVANQVQKTAKDEARDLLSQKPASGRKLNDSQIDAILNLPRETVAAAVSSGNWQQLVTNGVGQVSAEKAIALLQGSQYVNYQPSSKPELGWKVAQKTQEEKEKEALVATEAIPNITTESDSSIKKHYTLARGRGSQVKSASQILRIRGRFEEEPGMEDIPFYDSREPWTIPPRTKCPICGTWYDHNLPECPNAANHKTQTNNASATPAASGSQTTTNGQTGQGGGTSSGKTPKKKCPICGIEYDASLSQCPNAANHNTTTNNVPVVLGNQTGQNNTGNNPPSSPSPPNNPPSGPSGPGGMMADPEFRQLAQDRFAQLIQGSTEFSKQLYSGNLSSIAKVKETPAAIRRLEVNTGIARGYEKRINEFVKSSQFDTLSDEQQSELLRFVKGDNTLSSMAGRDFMNYSLAGSKSMIESLSTANDKIAGTYDPQIEALEKWREKIAEVEKELQKLNDMARDQSYSKQTRQEYADGAKRLSADLERLKAEQKEFKAHTDESIALRSQSRDFQHDQLMRQGDQLTRSTYGMNRGFIGRAIQSRDSALSGWQNYKVKVDAQKYTVQNRLNEMVEKGKGEGDKDYDKTAAELRDLEAASERAGSQIAKLSGPFGIANAASVQFGNTISMLATRFGRQIFNKILQEVKRFVKEYDKTLTNIQMITLKSNSEMETLGQGLIDKAKELKISFSEIAQMSTELYRQGLSDEEMEERLDTIAKFSKVSGTKATDATKLITTALNTGLVDDAQYAADVVTMLGDSAATNAAQIEKGIEKSGAAAAIDGTTYGQLVALLTAVTATTQVTGNVAGTTLNSIFGRMNKVGTKEIITDENGNTISGSAVATLLRSHGIQTNNSDGSRRSSFDLLYDLAQKYDTMSDDEQRQLATAIAGTRQFSNFSAIMTGIKEGEIDKYLDLLDQADGITDKKYDVYVESVQASLDNLKNTFDGLVQDVIKSGLATSFVDGLTRIVQGINNIVTSAGSLPGVLSALIPIAAIMAGLKSGSLPGIVIGLGIAGVSALALDNVGKSTTAEQRVSTSNTQYKEAYETRFNGIDRLTELRNTKNRTSEENKEYANLINKFAVSLGLTDSSAKDTIYSIDTLTDSLKELSGTADEAADNVIKEADEKKNQLWESHMTGTRGDSIDAIDKGISSKVETASKEVDISNPLFNNILWYFDEDAKEYKMYSNALRAMNSQIEAGKVNDRFWGLGGAISGALGGSTISFSNDLKDPLSSLLYSAALAGKMDDFESDPTGITKDAWAKRLSDGVVTQQELEAAFNYLNSSGYDSAPTAVYDSAKASFIEWASDSSILGGRYTSDEIDYLAGKYAGVYVTNGKTDAYNSIFGTDGNYQQNIDNTLVDYRQQKKQETVEQQAADAGLEYLGAGTYYIGSDGKRYSYEEAKAIADKQNEAEKPTIIETTKATYTLKNKRTGEVLEDEFETWEAANAEAEALHSESIHLRDQTISDFKDENRDKYSYTYHGLFGDETQRAEDIHPGSFTYAAGRDKNEAARFARDVLGFSDFLFYEDSDGILHAHNKENEAIKEASKELRQISPTDPMYAKTLLDAKRNREISENKYVVLDSEGQIVKTFSEEEGREQAESYVSSLTDYRDANTGMSYGIGEEGLQAWRDKLNEVQYWMGETLLGVNEEGKKAAQAEIDAVKGMYYYIDHNGEKQESDDYEILVESLEDEWEMLEDAREGFYWSLVAEHSKGHGQIAVDKSENDLAWQEAVKEYEGAFNNVSAEVLPVEAPKISEISPYKSDNISDEKMQEIVEVYQTLSSMEPDGKPVINENGIDETWQAAVLTVYGEISEGTVRAVNDYTIALADDLISEIEDNVPDSPEVFADSYDIVEDIKTIQEEIQNKINKIIFTAYQDIVSPLVTTGSQTYATANQQKTYADQFNDLIQGKEISSYKDFLAQTGTEGQQLLVNLLRTDEKNGELANILSGAVVENGEVKFEDEGTYLALLNWIAGKSSIGKSTLTKGQKADIATSALDSLLNKDNRVFYSETARMQEYDQYIADEKQTQIDFLTKQGAPQQAIDAVKKYYSPQTFKQWAAGSTVLDDNERAYLKEIVGDEDLLTSLLSQNATDEQVKYARRLIDSSRYGVKGLTSTDKYNGQKEVIDKIRNGGLSSYDSTVAAQYMSDFSGWNEYSALVQKQQNGEKLSERDLELLEQYNAQLEIFERNADIKLTIDGIKQAEELGEVLEGTASAIENIKKGGNLKIKAELELANKAHSNAQIGAKLNNGTKSEQYEMIKELTGWDDARIQNDYEAARAEANQQFKILTDQQAGTYADRYAAAENDEERRRIKAEARENGYRIYKGKAYYMGSSTEVDRSNPFYNATELFTSTELAEAQGRILTGDLTSKNTEENALYTQAAGKMGEQATEYIRMKEAGSYSQDELDAQLAKAQAEIDKAVIEGAQSDLEKSLQLSEDRNIAQNASEIAKNITDLREGGKAEAASVAAGFYSERSKLAMANNAWSGDLTDDDNIELLATSLGLNSDYIKSVLKTEDGKDKLADMIREKSSDLLETVRTEMSSAFGIELKEENWPSFIEELKTASEGLDDAAKEKIQGIIDALESGSETLTPEDAIDKYGTWTKTVKDAASIDQIANTVTEDMSREAWLRQYVGTHKGAIFTEEEWAKFLNRNTDVANIFQQAEANNDKFGKEQVNSLKQLSSAAALTQDQNYELQYQKYNNLLNSNGGLNVDELQSLMGDDPAFKDWIGQFEEVDELSKDLNGTLNGTGETIKNLNENIRDGLIEIYKPWGEQTEAIINRTKNANRTVSDQNEAIKKLRTSMKNFSNDEYSRKQFESGKRVDEETKNYFNSLGYDYKNDVKTKQDEMLDAAKKDRDAQLEALTEDFQSAFGNINDILTNYVRENPLIIDGVDVSVTSGTFTMDTQQIKDLFWERLTEDKQKMIEMAEEMGLDILWDIYSNGDGTITSVKPRVVGTNSNYTPRRDSSKANKNSNNTSAADSLIEGQSHYIKRYQHFVNMAQSEETYYERANDYQGYINAIDKEIDAQQNLWNQYNANIEALVAQRNATEEGSTEWYKLQEAIDSANESMADVANTIDEVNGKKISVVAAKQANEDAPIQHASTMLQLKAQNYLDQNDFESYVVATRFQISNYQNDIATNNAQLEEWEDLIGTYEEGTKNWMDVRDKIWALKEENAQLENQALEDTEALNSAIVSQIATDLTNQMDPLTHEQNMLSTWGNIYQNGEQWGLYRDTLSDQNDYYSAQISLYSDAMNEMKKEMSSLEEGTSAWYSARDAIYEYEEAIASATLAIQENDQAIEESIVSELTTKYNEKSADVEHELKMAQLTATGYKNQNDNTNYINMLNEELDITARSIGVTSDSLAEMEEKLTDGSVTEGSTQWKTLKSEIMSLRETLLQTQNSYDDLVQEIQEAEFQSILDDFTDQDDLTKHQIKLVQYEETKYQNSGELTNYGTMLNIETELQEKRAKAIEETIERLQEQLKTVEPGSAIYDEINQKIMSMEEEYSSVNNAIEKNNQAIKTNADNIIKARTSVENAIDKEIKNRIKLEKEMLSATVSAQDSMLDVIRTRYKNEWAQTVGPYQSNCWNTLKAC